MTDLLSLLVDLLEPFTRTASERQALLNRAFAGAEFLKDIVWDGVSTRTFVINTGVLLARQRVGSELALWKLLQVVREEVGVEQQAWIDGLREQVVAFVASVKMNGVCIFLSYARADDEPFVKRLHGDLTGRGLSVWWDRVSMPNRGLTFLQEIRDAIDASDRFVLVAGEGAFKSDYVRAEWEYALSLCKPVNVVLRKGGYKTLPPELANYDAPDFRNDAHYTEQLQTLIRQLADVPTPLGRLIGVPELPSRFLARPEDMAKLRDLVIADVQSPTVISAEKRTTALEGMGGIGKSVLAVAFACDCVVRRSFPDGIIWLTVGQRPSLRTLYQQVGVALGDSLTNYPIDENTCKTSAQNILGGKRCLIILDDVWEHPIGRAFRDLIAGMRTRLLITTRNLQINDLLGAKEHRVGLLDTTQSVALLRNWIGRDDPDLARVSKQLDYLPLALKLAGARMARDRLTGAEYVAKFDRVSRMRTDRKATDRDDNLDVSIRLGVDAVFGDDNHEKMLYYTFGIFPEDVHVPQVTVLRLWTHLRPGVEDFDLEELLSELVDLALVERHEDQTVTLHDLLHSYTKEKLGGQYVRMHNDLLDTYRPTDGWHTMPTDEPYLWDHLAYHLIEGGQGDQLVEVVKDLRYLSAKTHVCDVVETEADLYDAGAYAIQDTDLLLLTNQYTNMEHILKRCENIDQIRQTLHQRLQHLPILSDACTALLSLIALPRFELQRPLPDLPQSALVRTLIGHSPWVNDVAVSPNGEWIVSASYDETLRVWDARSGAERFILGGHTDAVTAVAVSPNGEWIVSASKDKTLRVWDARSGAERFILSGHTDAVTAVAVSPNGEWIASASRDKTLRIWNAQSGENTLTLRGHRHWITCMSYSPDSARIVSGSTDTTLKIWDAYTGQEILSLDRHAKLSSVAFSPDGEWIADASSDNTLTIRIAYTGENTLTLRGHTDYVCSVAYSPNGEWMVSASHDQTVKVWNARTGENTLTLRGHLGEVNKAVYTPDGKLIVSASEDGTIKVWSTDINETTLSGVAVGVDSVAYSPDGVWIVGGLTDGTLKVWDALTFENTLSLQAHESAFNSLAISPSGEWIVSTSHDNRLQVWNLHTGEKGLSLRHPDYVHSAAYNPDGTKIVTTSGISQNDIPDNSVRVWDPQTAERTLALKHERWVNCAVYSPDGRHIVSGSDDMTLKVWDAVTGLELHSLIGHTKGIQSVAYSPNGKWIVSASADHMIKIWEAATGFGVRTLIGHMGSVRSVVYSPDGQYILSTSDDQTLRAWDSITGACVATFMADGVLRSCAWSPDRQHIIVGGARGLYVLRWVE